MKTALITGVTSGIGLATARLLGKNNYNLIITGRRNELLQNIKNELEQSYSIKVLALNFDVCNRKQVIDAVAAIPEGLRNIDVLVNNAGLASGLGPIQDGDNDDWEKMIDTNIKGLLYITREISPLMIARNEGHIINISSIAGREVYSNGNVYCATKHAVEALSKAMRLDMVKHNIRVTAIAPGMVETEFAVVRFHGDTERAKNLYKGFEPLIAEDIADAILYAITRPAHVCINEMLIMPTAQMSGAVVNRS